MHYLPLGEQNLERIPQLLTEAASYGHWVLLDGLDFVQQNINDIHKFLNQMYEAHFISVNKNLQKELEKRKK